MNLTDIKIKNAKAKDKNYRLYDGDGMYLEVSTNGGKWWRFKYRYNNKEKRLSLGVYPDVGLKKARERRDECRQLVADGTDPSANRKAVKIAKSEDDANTFEVIAREWLQTKLAYKTEGYRHKVIRRLEINIFPLLGKRTVSTIMPLEILKSIKKVEERGASEMAHRLLQNSGQIFRFAIATGRLASDPTRDLKGALKPIPETKHLAAITNPDDVAQLLRAIDGYHGSEVVRCALKLAPLLFVRPGELRQAEWTEIDFEKGEWHVPAERMKQRNPHLVPLCRQALEILKSLYACTGHCKYLFPSPITRLRPMSNNAVLTALRRMGYTKDEMTGHGFRAMARTILDEVLGVRIDIIEHQLAHAVRDPNGRAYNRTSFLPERRAMMQKWGDYLDVLKTDGKVIPIQERVA